MSKKKTLYPGKLIALEGIDGSGKSTLSKQLDRTLHAHGIKTLLTKEPGATDIGKNIRMLITSEHTSLNQRAEFLLFAADRAQHFSEVVIPALHEGYVVISDRMADSSLAYQGFGGQLDCNMIEQVNQWAMQEISPDLVVYLRLSRQQAQERISQRQEKKTPFEQEHHDY